MAWIFFCIICIISWQAAAAPSDLPDPALTPGQWRDLSFDEICKTKWGRDHRAVTAAMKDAVFKRDGLTGNDDPYCTPPMGQRQRCEVDHRDPRELGGADVLANLWIQRYFGPWNAHLKDRLENRAHADYCAGKTTLAEARRIFDAPDWRQEYTRLFGAPR